MELGIYSFAEMTPDPVSGKTISAHQRISNLMEEIELADQVGLDVFAVGEHHRPDYAVSSPAVILAAAAVKTKSIRLSSAVTVLSSDDPVRVYQDFATIDLLSAGRAEIMAGRGSFIESFPLFGYNLEDYDELFSEKLDLLIKLNESEKINWKGKHRAAIDDRGVYPRPYGERYTSFGCTGCKLRASACCGNYWWNADQVCSSCEIISRQCSEGRSCCRPVTVGDQLSRFYSRHFTGGGRPVLPIICGCDDEAGQGAWLESNEPPAI